MSEAQKQSVKEIVANILKAQNKCEQARKRHDEAVRRQNEAITEAKTQISTLHNDLKGILPVLSAPVLVRFGNKIYSVSQNARQTAFDIAEAKYVE